MPERPADAARFDRLTARIQELEAAVAYQRQVAAAERRRADALEAAVHRAWHVALTPHEPQP